MNSIDLHTHILWDVDDGVQAMDESKQGLENASKDGIIALACTPHIIPGKTTKTMLDTIKQRFCDFEVLAKQYNVFTYLGSEVMINYDFVDYLNNDLVISINNTKYLLVEFDLRRDVTEIDYIEEYIEAIFDRGYIPIIAHIERYFPNGLNMAFIENLLDMGCILQCNRTSILGIHGKVIKDNSLKLLKKKCISLVCSDAHSASGNRNIQLSDTYAPLSQIVGAINARILLYDNPNNILNNMDIISLR